jgi:hypothetical protein
MESLYYIILLKFFLSYKEPQIHLKISQKIKTFWILGLAANVSEDTIYVINK